MIRLESVVQQEIRLEAAKHNMILWRNNSGVLFDAHGRPVRFGLCNESAKANEVFKSSDLIGIKPVQVTPYMVGKTVGVFCAIECKRSDWEPTGSAKEKAQAAFVEFIKSRGGLSCMVASVDAFKEQLGL